MIYCQIVAALVERKHAKVATTERDPATLQLMPFGSIPDVGKLEYFETLGVTETVLGLQYGARDDMLRELDDFTKIVAEFKGR